LWLDGMVPRPIVPEGPVEWSGPLWALGQSSFAFTADGRGVVAAARAAGRDRLFWIPSVAPAEGGRQGVSTLIGGIESVVRKPTATWGTPVELDVPYTAIDGVTAGPGGVVGFVGASFTGEPEVVRSHRTPTT